LQVNVFDFGKSMKHAPLLKQKWQSVLINSKPFFMHLKLQELIFTLNTMSFV
jgi:hypothetical protein